MQSIHILDTHTGGEPTRVVYAGPIDLGKGPIVERRERFLQDWDPYRRAIVCEPRGSDVMVGAILLPPEREDSTAGVIFFNNVGYLGMCGHGTIGVAIAIEYLERSGVCQFHAVGQTRRQLDTPVGPVQYELLGNGRVRIQNVPSYRYQKAVAVDLADGRRVHGDIAWGGNWFFVCDDHGCDLSLANLEQLQGTTALIRKALERMQITGANGQLIDHIELTGPSVVADQKNYVMCPGAAYDRSPCGTGTSAKVACLAADRKLAAGVVYRQESIVGSVFEASYTELNDGCIQPTIIGSAYVNAKAELLLDPQDPFAMGIE